MTLHYVIKKGEGSSGLLCPPGHYNHVYSAWGYQSPRHKTEISISSIDYVLNPKADASEAVRRRVQKIKDETVLVPSELWIREVYGYFKNMYLPESGSRNVADLVRDPKRGPENHAAVACIREYFPDHEPRLDLIENPGTGYGSWPCDKCGNRVQYEARLDALAVVTPGTKHWTRNPVCKDGGAHEVALYPADKKSVSDG